MGKRITTLGLLLVIASAANAAQTLLVREMFQGVGVYNSGSPGSFTSVVGTLTNRPVGPRTSLIPAPGWSCNSSDGTSKGIWDLTAGPASAAQLGGMAGGWFRFKSWATGSQRPFTVTTTAASCDNRAWTFIINSSGLLWADLYNTAANLTNGILSLDTWYWLGAAWLAPSSPTCTYWLYAVPLGGSFVPFGSYTNVNLIHDLCQVQFGGQTSGTAWSGRMGGVGVYSIASFSDVQLPADLIPPVEERHTWYLDSVNGDDANTGLVGSPWKTAAKFDAESASAGLIDVTNGYPNGDILIIDTHSGAFELGPTSLTVLTKGLTITNSPLMASANIITYLTLTNSDFSKTATLGNTYQIPCTNQGVVIWENDLWLNHPTGANFNAVSNSVDMTPGSFYADDSNLYLHPFGNTIPTSDGKTYTLSINREGGASAIRLGTSDVDVHNLRVRKTCLANKTDNNAYTAYGIQGVDGMAGTNRITGCYVDYYGYHGIGYTSSASNWYVETDNCEVEYGTPYYNSTAYVSFSGSSAATNNYHLYFSCVCTAATATIGTTNGSASQAWLSHDVGSASNEFRLFKFDSCNFSKGTVGLGNASTVMVTNCTIGTFTSSCITNYLDNSAFDYTTLDAIFVGGTLRCQNSLFKPTRLLGAGYVRGLGGNVTIQGNTFDLSSEPTPSPVNLGIFQRSTNLTMLFRDNVFYCPTSQQMTLLESAKSTDTLTFSNNVYRTGSSNLVMYQYNDGVTTTNRTFAQWQALGFDARSVNADPCLDAHYRPYAKTPCWTTGAELGPATDFTGKLFQSRRTAGAYEYVTPQPTLLMFGQ